MVKSWAQVLPWFTHNVQMKSDNFITTSDIQTTVRQSSNSQKTNFIKLLLSHYTVYGIFVWENFCYFWEIEYKIILKY